LQTGSILTKMDASNFSELLTSELGQECIVSGTAPVHGGDINACSKLTTNLGLYFVKQNSGHSYPNMFRNEANGLKALSTSSFKIPQVILAGDDFLVLEWLEKEKPSSTFWTQFGQSLAKMHQIQDSQFGFEEDNYIGSLTQSNARKNDWASFFIENRIEIQVKLAVDRGQLSKHLLGKFEQLYSRVEHWFPVEKPSLLHGDLWGGNAMCSLEDKPTLFDPAVYYGHREMDLAMTKLFGGFSAEMYRAYDRVFPLEKGFEERVNLCNLYPLLVHVNLFGGGYAYQVEQILKRFI